MNITISSEAGRKKPKIGDRRVTKKHGLQIRVLQTVETFCGNRAYVTHRGRHCYEWKTPAQLAGTQWAHLLTAEMCP